VLVTEAPLVGTGLEDKVAEDSGALVLARRSAWSSSCRAEMIAIRYERDEDEPEFDTPSSRTSTCTGSPSSVARTRTRV